MLPGTAHKPGQAENLAGVGEMDEQLGLRSQSCPRSPPFDANCCIIAHEILIVEHQCTECFKIDSHGYFHVPTGDSSFSARNCRVSRLNYSFLSRRLPCPAACRRLNVVQCTEQLKVCAIYYSALQSIIVLQRPGLLRPKRASGRFVECHHLGND